jgi:hypothetical protein
MDRRTIVRVSALHIENSSEGDYSAAAGLASAGCIVAQTMGKGIEITL